LPNFLTNRLPAPYQLGFWRNGSVILNTGLV
jgi:hypothetical protein